MPIVNVLKEHELKKLYLRVNEVVHVTGVSLNKSSISLTTVGQTEQLIATITPANADDQAVTWSSSDTSVATVDQTGLVTCVTPGSCTITVTTHDGGYTATCNVGIATEYILLSEGGNINRFSEGVVTGTIGGITNQTTYWDIDARQTNKADIITFEFNQEIVGFEIKMKCNYSSYASIDASLWGADASIYNRYQSSSPIYVVSGPKLDCNVASSDSGAYYVPSSGNNTTITTGAGYNNTQTFIGEKVNGVWNFTQGASTGTFTTNLVFNKISFNGYRWNTGDIGEIYSVKVTLQ